MLLITLKIVLHFHCKFLSSSFVLFLFFNWIKAIAVAFTCTGLAEHVKIFVVSFVPAEYRAKGMRFPLLKLEG